MSNTISSRLELQTYLEEVLGLPNVYFQPPPNVEIKIPAFVYNFSGYHFKNANDERYRRDRFYNVTLMTKDPEPPALEVVMEYPTTRFINRYPSSGVYYFIFSIRV